MPKKYGTGLYGKGKYSALTASSVIAAQGSFAEAGQAASFKWTVRLAAGFGVFTLAGFAAGLWGIAWGVACGAFVLAGQAVGLTIGNLWTATSDDTQTWTPETPGADPWTPVTAETQTWTPTL